MKWHSKSFWVQPLAVVRLKVLSSGFKREITGLMDDRVKRTNIDTKKDVQKQKKIVDEKE